ncbi:MAG TPA: SCO family protein, partial [Polyangia bacterium]|nr:SCO family protein [Polyangia bacterium]
MSGGSRLARRRAATYVIDVGTLSETAPRPDAGAVLRYLGAGMLAVATVVVAGVWLGHRLDPTWTQRRAPLKRTLPFLLPSLDARAAAWSNDVAGRPWILELRFPGCGADDGEVTARVDALAGAVRARTGRQPGWVTLLVGGLPTVASPGAARHVAPLDPGVLAQVAAQMGLSDSARAAAAGLLDARHWMFAVDGNGWVRGAADVTGQSASDGGWPSLEQALLAAAESPLPARAEPAAPAPAPSARLIDFRARDQDGRPFTAADLTGHPVVVDFIFTRCMGACPTLSARLAALRRMVASPEARFVSFSVDPDNDTPEVLRAYAARWGAPDPRWRLLATDAGTVRAVARGLGESVVQTQGGPILHSDHFTLIDRSGAVSRRVASGDVAAVRSLAAALDAQPSARVASAP